MVAPMGKVKEVLIVAPPRTGKTMMLQSIAQAISKIIQNLFNSFIN